MSVSLAASKSAIFAAARPPRLHAFGEAIQPTATEKKIAKRADALFREFGDIDQNYGTLMQEFGISEREAISKMGGAGVRAIREREGRPIGSGGRGSSSGVTPFQGFGSAEEARGFAQQKVAQLKSGIASYNRGILDWTAEKAQAAREDYWTKVYEGVLRNNPQYSEEVAAKQADIALEQHLKYEGRMSDYDIRLALGGLESGFNLSGPLITENADGTISLNAVQIRDKAGRLIIDLASELGQNVDKAA